MPLSIALLGQALINHDLRDHPYPDFRRLAEILGAADVRFSDLEGALHTPQCESPTREGVFLHCAEPVVLDCLMDLRINLLALSNNHAFDFGTGGILGTMAEVRARGVVFAGAGASAAAAAAPSFLVTPNGTVALVAAATGKVRPGGAATASRPGVNELRRDAAGALDGPDLERNLAAVAAAAAQADATIFYHHNHDWEPDNRDTPPWQMSFARAVIDAGATTFVGHGVPRMHGIEIYRGRPIFYGLGSFIFQTATAIGHYPADCWESAIAQCRFAGGRLATMELVPIALNERGVTAADHLETRGRPHLAAGAAATAILERLAALSRPFGTHIEIGDGVGRIAV